jgi:uncharacterized membrane protein YkvA (DUF1232 family)
MIRLIHTGYDKMSKNPSALARVREDLRTMLRLARAWVRKEYRALPWRSILYAVAALIYFVNPADVLPDALFGLGFVDDVAVITAVARTLHEDLEAFLAWETENRSLPSSDTPVLEPVPSDLPALERL